MKKEKSIKIKVIAIFTILCASISFISVFSGSFLSLYLFYRFNIHTRDAGSTGIIGGADGPTAIFVSKQSSSYLFTVIFALLTILGSIYLVVTKYKNKHN